MKVKRDSLLRIRKVQPTKDFTMRGDGAWIILRGLATAAAVKTGLSVCVAELKHQH